MNWQYPMQQGWQCPVCGRVYSPSTAICFYCTSRVVTSGDTQPTQPDESDTIKDIFSKT